MALERLGDQSILWMYNNIREQVMADAATGSRFVGEAAREQANRLQSEINRRGLKCGPINWP